MLLSIHRVFYSVATQHQYIANNTQVWLYVSVSSKHSPANIYYTKVHSMCAYFVKVKWSRYRPGVAQRVGRGIALLFHDWGTRRGWVVSSRPRPHFTPGKDPVPILHETGWAPRPVWTGGKPRSHRDSIPDRPAPSCRYTDWATGPTVRTLWDPVLFTLIETKFIPVFNNFISKLMYF